MSRNLLPIGTFVDHHNGHGYGKIIAYNDNYDTGLYTGERYPYRVRYLSGYVDVYSPGDFVVMPEHAVNEIRKFFGETE